MNRNNLQHDNRIKALYSYDRLQNTFNEVIYSYEYFIVWVLPSKRIQSSRQKNGRCEVSGTSNLKSNNWIDCGVFKLIFKIVLLFSMFILFKIFPLDHRNSCLCLRYAYKIYGGMFNKAKHWTRICVKQIIMS